MPLNSQVGEVCNEEHATFVYTRNDRTPQMLEISCSRSTYVWSVMRNGNNLGRTDDILVAAIASEEDSRTLICTAKLHSGELDFCSSTFGTDLVRPRLCVHLMTLECLDGGQLLAQK